VGLLNVSHIKLGIALLSLVAAEAAGATTILNGGFETPGSYHGSFQTLSAGSTALTGWAIGGSIDVINTYWAPASGAYSLDMSGNGAGSISQMLTGLSLGATYQLSFALAGNPAGTQGVKSLTASVGSLASTVTFNTTGKTTTAMGWQTVTLSFKATTANALLTLQSNTASAMGPALDNVSLAQVAAPSPGALRMTPPPPPGIVTNGSFEQAGGFSGGFETLGAGSTAMPGWKVTSGSVDLINGYWQAADGGYSLDMSGNSAGTIAQTLTGLVAGKKYLLSFDLASNPTGPAGLKSLTASVGGTSGVFTFDPAGHTTSAMGWQTEKLLFTATGPTTVLSFASGSNSAWGPALDNVSVASVPVPLGALFVLSGLGSILLLRRRRA
jgi:choice-of-anchor C domain-containing protein